MVLFSFAHWRFVFSKIRRTVYGMFYVLLGRTFVFGLHTKKPLKNLKTFFEPSFFQPS